MPSDTTPGRPALTLRAGASGYSYKPWKGPFYPADLEASQMLGYYAGRLPTVEINNTFYRPPKAEVLADWAAQTPAGFRFALKASRRISHLKRLKDVAELVAYLFATAATLADKLGPVLVQLPPNMKKDLERLRVFLDLVPVSRQVAMEFRHESWLEDDVLELLKARGVALVIAETDEAKDPEVQATASFGYLRLRREDYDDAGLARWAERIQAQTWSETYVFFKHEDDGAAPKLALRLMELCGPTTGHRANAGG